MKIYAFAAALSLAALFIQSTPIAAQDPLWVRDNTWYFDNFTKDSLGWDMFRETFIGVAPAPSGDFDQLFYDNLYKKKLASSGLCHGMCTMAALILKNGGHLGYCHPPYVYSGVIADNTAPAGAVKNDTVGPTDPTLNRAIIMMHGSQISHGFLTFLLDIFSIAKNRDGRYAYDQLAYYTAKNDPCVISVTSSLIPDPTTPGQGGHVLMPFYSEDLGGGHKRIYVYDVNRSYYKAGAEGHDFYHNRLNFIDINSSGAWSYNMGGSTGIWSGNPGSGGNCMVIPISIAGRKDRLPQSLLAEGAYAINTIFIFGENAHVVQVSDPLSNRRYLNEKGSDVETDDQYRLPNIMLFQPQNGGLPTDSFVQTYFVRGDNPTLDVQIRAKGKYRVGMLFGGKYTEKEAEGDGTTLQMFRTVEKLNAQ